MAKTEPMSIRLSPEIKHALQEVARIEHRPMNNLIEFLIIERCRNMGISVGESTSVNSTGGTTKITNVVHEDKVSSKHFDRGQKCK